MGPADVRRPTVSINGALGARDRRRPDAPSAGPPGGRRRSSAPPAAARVSCRSLSSSPTPRKSSSPPSRKATCTTPNAPDCETGRLAAGGAASAGYSATGSSVAVLSPSAGALADSVGSGGVAVGFGVLVEAPPAPTTERVAVCRASRRRLASYASAARVTRPWVTSSAKATR
ncbi:hypothetical protein JNW90_30055 [Micromonospora sp. STR1s_5]|nr:hypothetical protein [Micromonospora sp. STR1s_5]